MVKKREKYLKFRADSFWFVVDRKTFDFSVKSTQAKSQPKIILRFKFFGPVCKNAAKTSNKVFYILTHFLIIRNKHSMRVKPNQKWVTRVDFEH